MSIFYNNLPVLDINKVVLRVKQLLNILLSQISCIIYKIILNKIIFVLTFVATTIFIIVIVINS